MKNLYVQVAFPTGRQLYTYRTPIDLAPKSVVVVVTPRGCQIAEVHRMIDETKVDLNVSFDYKWIVQEVDFTEYRFNMAKDVKSPGVKRL